MFDVSKSLPHLVDLSVNGSLLAPKLMRKIIRHSSKSPSRRGAGKDALTGRLLRDRFVGVLDSSTGASQKDVEK